MSEDPKSKPEQRVPSFDELKAPKRPAAPPSHELGQEEKTSTIDPELLRKALAQTKVGAPIEPPAKPPPVALSATGKLPLAVPPRQPPPPPGSRPPAPAPTWDDKTADLNPNPKAGGDITTDPETSPVGRAVTAPAMPAVTAPALPQIKPQTAVSVPIPGRMPPPAPGSKPVPGARQITERMEPVTPDMIHPAREKAPRGQAPVQAAAQAIPKPDPSLFQTNISIPHQRPPSQSSPTVLELEKAEAPQKPPLAAVTQPHAENPFVSKRAAEPSSEPRPAAPPVGGGGLQDDDEEPLTKNERPMPKSSIEADIVSEVKKLIVAEAPTSPGVPDEVSAGTAVSAVEVLAHPAPTLRLFAAFTIDALVLAVLAVVLGFVVMAAGKAPPLPPGLALLDQLALRVNEAPKLIAATVVLAAGLGAAYSTLFSVALSGRTIGRLVAGLNLVDATGAPPSAMRALARSLCALLSIALGGLGFWLGLFNAKSQTLHDKLCSTYVVRLGPSRT